MIKIRFFIVLIILIFSQLRVHAQRPVINKTITYEKSYDDPYDLNKLYIHIQPVYGELFMTNVNIGFGFEADYFLKDLLNLNFNFRKAYGQKFDFMRDVAEKNSDVLNTPKKFFIVELGGTYHIKDTQTETPSRFVLYSRNYTQQNKWETMVPEYIEAPANLRKVIGIRAGGVSYQSAVDVNRIMKDQEITFADSSGAVLSGASVYSNIVSSGFYLGGSLQLIRNVALSFDKTYQPVSNDLIFTVFADILILPFNTIDNIYYKSAPDADEITLNTDVISLNMLGARAGIKGMFNRDMSFGYSVETGYRPGIKGENFYLLGKISFPVFGSRLEKEVDAFGK